jgi:hypothetical protein
MATGVPCSASSAQTWSTTRRDPGARPAPGGGEVQDGRLIGRQAQPGGVDAAASSAARSIPERSVTSRPTM